MFWIILGFVLMIGSAIAGMIFSDPFWPGLADFICPLVIIIGLLFITYGSGGFSFLKDYDWSNFFAPIS